MSSKKMDSSSLAAAALNTLPSRSALQQHAAHSLSLSASLTLPPSSTLASLLQEAEQRASLATQHQQQAKEELLAHLQHTADSDRSLTSTLSALPEQIDECDEAILTLSSPAALALEKTLHSHIQARTKLQTARDYFNLLASAEDLRVQALATNKDDVKSALPALSKLSVLYDQAEALLQDERIRGLVFIRAQRDFTFHELRKRAINNLRAACEAAGWSPTAAAAAASSVDPSQTNAQTPPVRRLDAHKEVQHAWKDLCRFQRTAERLGLMPRATAPLLQMDSAASDDDVTTEQAPRPGSPEYVPLLAVTILLDVLLLRFRYHFDSSRPSNRLDKPEWYLSHILGLVRAYGIDSDLFRPGTGSVARLCALGGWGRSHGVVPTTTTNKNGAVKAPERMLDTGAELLHGLLVPLRAKLIASMPLLLPHPALLAHTISEYIVFDDALRQTYPPSNLEAPDTTRGPALSLADQVLNNSEWFAAWLEGERAHAEERLDEILNAGDAWAIQSVDGVEDEEDGVPAAVAQEDGTAPVQRFPTQPSTAKGTETNGQTPGSRTVSSTYKTVRSAQQIVELLESVQDRAAPLPLLTHRLAFFARIQLPLLRAYADRLTRSLDAFESLSKAFARAMPGAIEGVNLAVAGAGGPNLTAGSGSNAIGISSGGGGAGDADMVRGLRGLGRLLKAHLSAAHIVDTLSRWNDTAYFLALSLELRETEEGKKLAVELAVADGEAEEAELDNASLVSLLRKSLRRQGGGGGGGGMDVRGRGAEFVAAAGAKIRSRSTSRSREASVDVGGARGRVGGVEGGVWDDILVKYRGLLRRATVAMERLVVHEIVDALKPYAYRRWDEGQIEDEDDIDGDEDDEEPSRVVKQITTPIEPIPTPSLLPALTLLSTHLGHLLPALPSHYALPIYRSIAGTLSTQIVDRVVMSGGAHRFTYAGGQRFARDIEAGWFGVLSDLTLNFGGRRTTSNSSTAAARLEAAHEAMGRRPRAAWRELEAVGTLLSLPPTLPPTKTNEDESATTTTTKWTLERTTRALFEADEEDDERGWSAVRRELKMEGGGGGAGLMHGRAREVVRRRIECAR